MSIRFLLLLACMLAVVLGGKINKTNKKKSNEKHEDSTAEASGPQPAVAHLPVGYAGHTGYGNGAPHINPHNFKNAEVRLNRFPGGVSYSTNEQGYGANVQVNFHSYPSQTQSYGQNKGQY